MQVVHHNQLTKLLFVTAAISIFFSSSVFSTEYIVKFRSNQLTKDSVDKALSITGAKVIDHNNNGSLVKVEIDAKDEQMKVSSLSKIRNLEGIEYIVENVNMHAFATPDDPQIEKQWALKKINAEGAWKLGSGSKDIVVAIIDTGVDTKHEDLKANMWVNTDEIAGNGSDDDNNGFIDDINGWDFRQNDNDPYDVTGQMNPGHGTHCSGVIGAVGNNGVGVSGINHTVSLMALRFLGEDGQGDLFSSTKAIDYAINNGAHVISASWGAAIPQSGAQPIIDAIKRASDKGVIFVAAAANDGKSNDTREVYPANAGLPNMISVAASNPQDGKPYWSNFGRATVDLASPGENILSTVPKNGYSEMSGTSMATPLVAGLVGLLMSQDSELTGPEARSILQVTGAKADIETACNCRVDAEAALTAVVEKTLTVVPAAKTLAPQAKQQFSGYGGEAPYTFKSSNTKVATISPSGELSALAEGETTVTITDANGVDATSLAIRVANKAPNQTGPCPFPDPQLCQIMCMIPSETPLPWC